MLLLDAIAPVLGVLSTLVINGDLVEVSISGKLYVV
jgi:hypothetical protein